MSDTAMHPATMALAARPRGFAIPDGLVGRIGAALILGTIVTFGVIVATLPAVHACTGTLG